MGRSAARFAFAVARGRLAARFAFAVSAAAVSAADAFALLLCAVDPGQYGCLSFGESTEIAYNQVQHLANSFHQRGVKKAKATCDPLVDDAVAMELGYSTMAGGSKLQMAAWRKGEAFELRATAKAPELNAHAEVAAKLAWEHLLRRFPKIGEKMLTEAGKYGIHSTS